MPTTATLYKLAMPATAILYELAMPATAILYDMLCCTIALKSAAMDGAALELNPGRVYRRKNSNNAVRLAQETDSTVSAITRLKEAC